MMDTDEGEITFEEQLALEQQERKQQEDVESGRVKVDPDGTVYDWDAEKKAWFPRINEDFIARYQMSYGTDVQSAEQVESGPADSQTGATSSGVAFSAIPPAPDVNDPGYASWYYTYGTVTNSQEYRDWYDYYYGQQGADSGTQKDAESRKEGTVISDPHDEGYWEQYKEQAEADERAGITVPNVEEDESNADGTDAKNEKGKKKKKPKPPPKPASWFDMQDENNTNVYISGLPPTITLDDFKALVNKCGLIAFDPITKKPKLKLYKDDKGNPKGDGLCCYIKQESIELALKILDGYVLDGHTLSVEKARFELKGKYDPTKRKRKLTNKEKKAFREKQAKLFEWRPDKPRFARSRHEKTVIVKNVFTLADVDKNLLLVSELEEDLRTECAKFGQVKKVKLYERNPEGIASVTFAEAEEADVCKEALNGRWFACRQLTAETWDGKTKYAVEETEEEYKERLKKWEAYLEGKSHAEGKTGVDSSAEMRSTVKQNDTSEARGGASEGEKCESSSDELVSEK